MSLPTFISADDLAARLAAGDPIRVLEARRDDTVSSGTHLPGAVPISLTADLSRPAEPATAGKRPLPRIADLQTAARRWGLRADTAVAVYDHDGDFVAARAWWVLRWAGLRDVAILDGGVRAWVAAGHATGALATDVTPGDVVLSAGHLDELDADGAARLAEQGRLLDARGATAYADGHIPGARNVGSGNTFDDDGTLRPAAELRRLYGVDGVDAAPPGLYCGGGVAGAHAVAVLAHLGVEAPLYVGSFSAWSADPARPVATGADTAETT
jgi:thiosulfate/3-mercaptopyruvate sulfurtransferase